MRARAGAAPEDDVTLCEVGLTPGALWENSGMNKHEGSTLESLFEDLGELDDVQARAIKKILALQAERRMKELGLTATALASSDASEPHPGAPDPRSGGR